MRGQSVVVSYSSRCHKVVKRLPFHNVSSFVSSDLFTVIVSAKKAFLHFEGPLTNLLFEHSKPTHSSHSFLGMINHTTYYFFVFDICLRSYIDT